MSGHSSDLNLLCISVSFLSKYKVKVQSQVRCEMQWFQQLLSIKNATCSPLKAVFFYKYQMYESIQNFKGRHDYSMFINLKRLSLQL